MGKRYKTPIGNRIEGHIPEKTICVGFAGIPERKQMVTISLEEYKILLEERSYGMGKVYELEKQLEKLEKLKEKGPGITSLSDTETNVKIFRRRGKKFYKRKISNKGIGKRDIKFKKT